MRLYWPKTEVAVRAPSRRRYLEAAGYREGGVVLQEFLLLEARKGIVLFYRYVFMEVACQHDKPPPGRSY